MLSLPDSEEMSRRRIPLSSRAWLAALVNEFIAETKAAKATPNGNSSPT